MSSARPTPRASRARLTSAALAAAALAACADTPAERVTAAAATPAANAVAAATPPDSVVTSFAWLAPTVTAAAPAAADTFDAPALARLAVEVCALGSSGACAGAPVARYTAATNPAAQRVRADTVRQFFLAYWNTAASAGAPVVPGLYRARVLDGAREVGALDVRVGAQAADLAGVDRASQGAVVRGQQFALRFRAGRRTVARAEPTPTSDSTSADLLRQAAEQLYAVADSGVDVTPGVRAVLGQLMPVLGAAEQGELDARLAEGLPAAYDFQVDLVGRAFNQRARTSAANFAAAAAEAGATAQGGGALTAAVLAEAMRAGAGQTAHGPETLIPALVRALGEARARRAGVASPDPVWGDGQLDALQTTLLMYSLQYSGLDRAAPPGAAAVRLTPGAAARSAAPSAAPSGLRRDLVGGARTWIGGKIADLKANKGTIAKNQVRGFVTGEIGKRIEMPLTWSQAAKASACASVLLNSYRFDVAATPTGLGREGLGLPRTSDVDATLAFDFVPNAFGAVVLSKIGCTLPANGAAPGKRVQWAMTGEIPSHGTIVRQDAVTGAGGRARAQYMTLSEVVPPGMRLLAKEATGTVDVRATELVPGWKNLERSVGVGVQNPTDAGVRLFVRHYDWPSRVRVEFEVALKMTGVMGGSVWEVGRAGTLTLDRQEKNGAVFYHGAGPARYTHFRSSGGAGGCVNVATGTRAGGFGFSLVAADPTGAAAPVSGVAYPGGAMGAELFNTVCPHFSVPNELGGFYTGLLGVYEPVEHASLPLWTKRPVTTWTPAGPGVLTATVSRTVPTLFAPTTETSTYRLTFQP